jgi:integrating conjugative element protein (TIGR03755 family)
MIDRHASTPLTSPLLPWLLAAYLGLAPVIHPLLDPVPAAHAQSRIDALKGALGVGVRSDDVPAGNDGWSFSLGTGADVDGIVPATYARSLAIDANFSAGFGYACGKFNAFDNVEAMINQTMEKFKQLPQMFVMAVQGAIASLPAYLLNKINPSLYNVVTKNLDEAFRLFEVNFKDCQQIEREIALGQNPYHHLVMAGIGDRLRVEMGFGEGTIDERMKAVRENGPSNGIVMSDGRRYGGEGQEPIAATQNVATAGINLLTGRSASDDRAFEASLHEPHPITQVFDSPQALVAFLTEIYGAQAFMLTETGPTQSTPGVGYPQQYVAMRDDAIEHLQNVVRREIEREAFEAQSGMTVAPAALEEIRRLPPYSQSIAIDDRARQHALEQLTLKLDFALQALKTGLKEPNLAQSEAYEVIEREINQLMMEIQDDRAQLDRLALLR